MNLNDDKTKYTAECSQPDAPLSNLKHHWGTYYHKQGDSGWVHLAVVDFWHGSIRTIFKMGVLSPEIKHCLPSLIILYWELCRARKADCVLCII